MQQSCLHSGKALPIANPKELHGAYAPALVIKETEPSLIKVGGAYMAPGQSMPGN
jgi:hypothetical protein